MPGEKVKKISGSSFEMIIADPALGTNKSVIISLQLEGQKIWFGIKLQGDFKLSLIEVFCQFFTFRETPTIAYLVNNMPKFNLTLCDFFDENPEKTYELIKQACDSFLTNSTGSTLEQLYKLRQQVAESNKYVKLRELFDLAIQKAEKPAA